MSSKGICADTHAVIWCFNEPERLSRIALEVLRSELDSGGAIHISAITLVELTFAVERGRIPASVRDRILSESRSTEPTVIVRSLDAEVAESLSRIPRSAIPEMPDRIIAATVPALSLPLVTRDQRIRESGVVTTVW